nr:hypothetical protein [Tanacetum cinerariifolium]
MIRAKIREEFRTSSGSSDSGGNPPPVTIHTWLERFNKQKPHSFEKATAPVDAKNWISHMEKIFDVMGCEDAFKTRLAVYKFEGNAFAWWKAYKQAKGGDAWLITVTWEEFKKLFFLQFFPRAEQERLKREYHSIRQTNTETSTEFMQRFVRLAGFLGAAADRRGGGDNHRSSNNNYSGNNNRLNFKSIQSSFTHKHDPNITIKFEALKERTKVSRPIKAFTVYPLNTPAALIPKVLPTKIQVKILIFTLIQLFSEFDQTCKKRITPSAITDGERGFEQTKACYLQEVIPFFKTLKDNFEGIQKALTKEVKEMKDVFQELEAEVAQHAVVRKHDAIELKNLLIANDNLIAECLSQEVFCVATNSELNAARFTDMHDNQTELITHFSKLEVSHLNLQLKYQDLKDQIGNSPPTPDKDTPDFDSVFVIGKLQASLQGKDNTTDSKITKLTDQVTHLQAQNDLFRAKNDKIKQHYKELYDSIKITRAKHIEQVTKLTTENMNLKAGVRVDCCPIARGSQPMSHVKPNRISPVKDSVCQQSTMATPSIHHNRSVERKVKQVWKPKHVRQVWKPTGKVLTTIGHQWRPIGRIFDLENQCPLTKFTPPKVVSSTQHARRTNPCANQMEPHQNWGSNLSNAGRTDRPLLCGSRLLKVGERVIEGPEIIEVTNKKSAIAKEKLKEARTRQKSYADKHRRSLEFQPGDHVLLKVSPARGVRCFGIKGKLSPRFIRPFEMLDRVDEVSYHLALPPQLSHVHNVFHVFLLRWYKYHPLYVISYPLDQIHIDLSYVKEPDAILDRQDRVMRKKTIPFVKILWRNHPEREATWQTEESIRTSYPHFLP